VRETRRRGRKGDEKNKRTAMGMHKSREGLEGKRKTCFVEGTVGGVDCGGCKGKGTRSSLPKNIPEKASETQKKKTRILGWRREEALKKQRSKNIH